MAETIKIGGELESMATGNVVAAASAIKDKVKNKYQGEINAETDAALEDRYTKAETYNKTELNNMITTPEVGYVTVTATDQTVSETDVLPATGSADTVYRVGSWDGTQYDNNKYSEYAWNGSIYILLAVRDGALLGEYIENPEYIRAVTDSAGHLLAWIKVDGGIDWAIGVPKPVKDYVAAEIAKILNGSVSTDIDGINKIIAFLDDFSTSDTLAELLATKVDKEENKGLVPLQYVQETENPEYVDAKSDSKDKLLEGTREDGTKVIGWDLEVMGKVSSPKVVSDKILLKGIELSPVSTVDVTEIIEDPENRLEIKTDNEKKIISYRKPDGTLVESAGIETKEIKSDALLLSNKGLKDFEEQLKNDGVGNNFEKDYYLPKFGMVNIKTETFYLEKTDGVGSISDVHVEQILEDTDANAEMRLALGRFYKNGSSHADSDGILFFAASDITEIEGVNYAKTNIKKLNGVCYYENTLGATGTTSFVRNLVIENYSIQAPFDSSLAEGEVKEVLIEVSKFTSNIDTSVWLIDKHPEHRCVADIDFGTYYNKINANVGVKYQGAGTTRRRKRNFRLTFYKDNKYKKKDKVKIGSMLRLSGFNMKAEYFDNSKIRELLVFRIVQDIWKDRPEDSRFPWDKKAVGGMFNGATGCIEGFPIELYLGPNTNSEYFYGLDMFFTKKDEKNYLLDGDHDASGIFINGDSDGATAWTQDRPSWWNDELDAKDKVPAYPAKEDSVSVDTAEKLKKFFAFINNRLYIGSDENEYRNVDLTFFVNDTSYTYDQVTVNDDGEVVLIEDESVEITAIYVTSTLQPDGVTAARTEYYAYRGSDGELYYLSELTDISGTLYVTSTLSEGQPTQDSVTAALITPERHVYEATIDGVIKRYISTELIKINDVYYVPEYLTYVPTEDSISATIDAFDTDNIPERMDVLGFIDDIISIQLFLLWDNTHRNVILYSDSDKKKFSPFIYDVDNSLSGTYDRNIFDMTPERDKSLWLNIVDKYWDQIVNRWCYLRSVTLSSERILSIGNDIINNIPDEAYQKESIKWSMSASKTEANNLMAFLLRRLDWLDKNYFKV